MGDILAYKFFDPEMWEYHVVGLIDNVAWRSKGCEVAHKMAPIRDEKSHLKSDKRTKNNK